MVTIMRNNVELRRSASILLVKAEAAAAVSSCGHHHRHFRRQLHHYEAVLLSKPRIGGASAAAGAATNNIGLLKQHPKWRDVSSSFNSSFSLPFSTATTNTSNISNNNDNNDSDNDSVNDNDIMKLYQYAICPFCNITKAVLHYHKIPYKAIEVNPLTKSELNDLSKDYRKVPILTTTTTSSPSEQQQYNGTDDIIEYLTTKKDYSTMSPSNNNNNSTNNEFDDDNDQKHIDSSSIEEKEWILFARDELAPLLYPNICSTWSQAYETMSYVHNKPNNFSTIQKYSIQYIGSFAMYMAASKIKKKRNIVDEQTELYEILQQWEDHLKTSRVGDGGGNNNISLGELSIYGVLRGLKGLPVHTNVMSKFPHVSKWYNEMENQIEVEHQK